MVGYTGRDLGRMILSDALTGALGAQVIMRALDAVTEIRDMVVDLTDEMATLRAQNNDLFAALTVMGAQMGTFSEAIASVAGDVDTLVTSSTELTADVDRLVAAFEGADNLTADQQAEIDAIRTKVGETKAALDAANAKIDAASPAATGDGETPTDPTDPTNPPAEPGSLQF